MRQLLATLINRPLRINDWQNTEYFVFVCAAQSSNRLFYYVLGDGAWLLSLDLVFNGHNVGQFCPLNFTIQEKNGGSLQCMI